METTRDFFEGYRQALNAPAKVAEFYHEPFIAARMGTTRLNATRRDTEQFFVEILEKYRSKGFEQAVLLEMQERPLGANSKLATVRWAYQDGAARTL